MKGNAVPCVFLAVGLRQSTRGQQVALVDEVDVQGGHLMLIAIP